MRREVGCHLRPGLGDYSFKHNCVMGGHGSCGMWERKEGAAALRITAGTHLSIVLRLALFGSRTVWSDA